MFKNKNILISLIIFSSIIISLISLKYLPNTIAIHFGLNLEPDNFTNKYLGVFIIPVTMIIIFLSSSIMTKLNKKTANQELKKIILELEIFLLIINIILILSNINNTKQIINLFPLIIGIYFLILSNSLQKIPQNILIGFRTPKTLKNKKEWKKYNNILSNFLKIIGILLILISIQIKYSIKINILTITIVTITLFLITKIYLITSKKKTKK